MWFASASLQSERAERYLLAMCKHFAHKVEVKYDKRSGWAALPPGTLTMNVDGNSIIFKIVAGDREGIERCKYIVDAHIVRFAFREKISGLDWSTPQTLTD